MNIDSISNEVMESIKFNSYSKTKKGLPLKENHMEVLRRYDIDYDSISSMDELIYIIESVLEECGYPEDLDNVSYELSEFSYYNYTNK